MKHLWILAICSATLLSTGLAHASEGDEEKEIEVEEAMADANGSIFTNNAIRSDVDRQKVDTELNVAAADKSVRQMKYQQNQAQTSIAKAEAEMRALKLAEKQALTKQQEARKERTDTIRKLAVMIKQIKAYREQVKKAQLKRDREQTALKAVKDRLAKAKAINQKIASGSSSSQRPVRTASSRSVPNVNR